MSKLVLASSNPGKLTELSRLLAPLNVQVVPQSSLGIKEVAEPHATFVENALVKARHACRASGLPALADDSGLCVMALDGAPGVHSARYGQGEQGSARTALLSPAERDAQNNARLVRALAGAADRRAYYYCVLVLMRHAGDPIPMIVEGRWEGSIVDQPRGANGFGYDPHFAVTGLNLTAAELDSARKDRISHRGVALARLAAQWPL